MANNYVQQVISVNSNWTAPGGVSSITIIPNYTNLDDQRWIGDGVVSGSTWGLARTSSGSLYSWGANGSGQLGTGDVTPRSSPTLISGYTFSKVYTGNDGAIFGQTTSGITYAWGLNANGQLGLGNVTPYSTPQIIPGDFVFTRIVRTQHVNVSTFGLVAGGAVYAWGDNTGGCLGVGTTGNAYSSPTLVLGLPEAIKDLTGHYNSCTYALGVSGTAYAWGNNAYGSLGVGDTNARSSAVTVVGGLTFQKIVTDTSLISLSASCYGLTTGGDLYAWGQNNYGQLGVNDTTNRSSPTLVVGGLKWANVWPITYGCLALTTGGQLYAWGYNPDGRLGSGDVISRSTPNLVLGSLGIPKKVVSSGGGSVFVINQANAVYAWGNNNTGNIATGDLLPRSSPVAILGGLKVAQISVVSRSEEHTSELQSH